jgi:hypothetical protein
MMVAVPWNVCGDGGDDVGGRLAVAWNGWSRTPVAGWGRLDDDGSRVAVALND